MGSRSSSGRARKGAGAPDRGRISAALAGARAMVLDFDGTLVDSNPIKMRGFEAVFADFPERLPKIMAYCQGGPETPRGQKFKHVYEVILGRALTAAARKRDVEYFSRTRVMVDFRLTPDTSRAPGSAAPRRSPRRAPGRTTTRAA